MSNGIRQEDAQSLLRSTQQLRTHWSGVITSHLSLAITINAGIWSYFLKSYLDSVSKGSTDALSYIAFSGGISTILLGLWRLYTRYLDDNIANLYPDFLLYEGVLDVPVNRGTSGYLIRNVPNVDGILKGNFTLEKKVEAIAKVVRSKRIGSRGHWVIDLFVSVISLFILSVTITLSIQRKLDCSTSLITLSMMGVGILFLIVGILRYQRNPSENFIIEIIKEMQQAKPTTA